MGFSLAALPDFCGCGIEELTVRPEIWRLFVVVNFFSGGEIPRSLPESGLSPSAEKGLMEELEAAWINCLQLATELGMVSLPCETKMEDDCSVFGPLPLETCFFDEEESFASLLKEEFTCCFDCFDLSAR